MAAELDSRSKPASSVNPVELNNHAAVRLSQLTHTGPNNHNNGVSRQPEVVYADVLPVVSPVTEAESKSASPGPEDKIIYTDLLSTNKRADDLYANARP